MARPVKTGIDYFSLDTKFDDEVILIMARHGAEGLGILVTLWQLIYNNGYYLPWTEKELLLYNNRFYADSNKVDAVIEECLKWEIFSNELYGKYQILTSSGIQKRFLSATERRTEVIIDKRFWITKDINDNINWINDNINSKNADISTQSKGKEIKKESKEESIEKYNQIRKAYPGSKTAANAKKKLPKIISKYGADQILRAVNRYIKSVEAQRANGFSDLKYMQESTFWNGRFEDFLDVNFSEEDIKPKNQNQPKLNFFGEVVK